MPAAKLPQIEIAVTPRFDVFYALYALSSAGPSTLDAWKAAARRRLPDDFGGIAKRVAPLPIFWPLLADAVQSVPGEISFEQVLATIGEVPAEELQRNVLSGIFHERATVASLVSQKRNLKAVLGDEDLPGVALLEHFGLLPFDQTAPAVKAMTSLLAKPNAFRDDLIL